MKVLSVRQPWASLIMSIKDIENRTWKTNYRGRILIHSSLHTIPHEWEMLNEEQIQTVPFMLKHTILPYGAIIGSVELIDCTKNYSSIWAEKGVWNWVLKNPILFEHPIMNIKGKLGLWEYPLMIT